MSRHFAIRELGLATAACLVLGNGALAAPVKFTIDPVEGASGSEIRVPIGVKNGQGVGAIQFHLRYDPKVLEWKDGEVDAGVQSAAPDFKLVEPGRVRVALVLGDAGITGGQAIVNALFKATGAPGSSSALTMEAARAWTHKDIVEMQVETQAGEVKVVEQKKAETQGGIETKWIVIGCAAAVVVIAVLFLLVRRKRPVASG